MDWNSFQACFINFIFYTLYKFWRFWTEQFRKKIILKFGAASFNFYLYEFLIQHCAIKPITLFALSQLQSYFGLGAESRKGQQIQFWTFALLNTCCVKGQRAGLFFPVNVHMENSMGLLLNLVIIVSYIFGFQRLDKS